MSNPYQIRSDLLAMAKNMMDKQYDMQMQIAQNMFEMHKENAEQAVEAWERYIPKMYTPEELMAKAKELYTFVQDDKK